MNTPRSCHLGSARRSHRAGGVTALAGLTAATLLLGACGSGTGGTSESGKPTVVASTDMWAGVARAVAGDEAEVESIIDSAAADPHSYESTPRDAARLDRADLVVYNGGGYDAFVSQLLSDGDGTTDGIEAVSVADSSDHSESSGHSESSDHSGSESSSPGAESAHQHGESDRGHGHADSGHGHQHSGNEHVWYDPETARHVADRIATRLGELRPERAERFERNATEFGGRLDEIERSITELRNEHHDTEVMTTAPVADHLLANAGLTDITPDSFVRTVESGNDPAAATVAELQELVGSGRPAVLIHNPQTSSPLTERITERARNSGVPVVAMQETLPDDRTYTEWLSGRVTALDTALDDNTGGQ
ncbi:zinc/manganese transport system substrate-binding protein [Actinopolyspora mzabensis]|uniref:Zinc/manganese transport system substrate-binding protein n=1 Tax=Actinopolyspora mzabensis TaxID=995066 RepID=A0A1G9CBS5_ACTMZ|nr:zinc ABC transporter substrate-binding protein [Actinopolyspora mzabensis]SDK49138.1 zinc/manganese transport system substrate-binding protein [Actinopolyspora mzabensis]